MNTGEAINLLIKHPTLEFRSLTDSSRPEDKKIMYVEDGRILFKNDFGNLFVDEEWEVVL